MTPKEQRIAIAEACGWKHTANLESWFHSSWPESRGIVSFETIPDYLNDLNAILPVIRKIPPAERDQYQNIIWHICDKLHRMTPVTWLVTTAEAHQHCEAFLRLKKLWKD